MTSCGLWRRYSIMRSPEFWYRPAGVAALLLTPFGWIYRVASAVRQCLSHPVRADVPVVCIGNLVAGGAGKTPISLAVAALLRDRQPHFLTRGYGGRLTGPVLVDPQRHSVDDVGDEALLLAAAAPTWLAHDRVAGARAAAEASAGVIVMDDGFQNPHLAKDISLIVIDGQAGLGNGLLMPAGPLREPPARGLRRAQGVVMIGADRHRIGPGLPTGLPCFAARLTPTNDARTLAGQRVVAFAGIGRPEKFFATLDELGCIVSLRRPFPDHHRFTDTEFDLLVREAATHAATLATTAKDAVRLSAAQRARVRVVDVTLSWDDEASVRRLLADL
jgi:tetraacyldisaccharide 4'-kinase